MSEVRYRENGDNRLLRHVLRLAWEQQCYWCRNYKDYLDLEIDHIVPRTSGQAQLSRLKRDFGLADSYDVHAPYNLAPICKACNGTKGNEDFTATGFILTTLRKAARLAPKVIRQVIAFPQQSKLASALLEAVEADLSDTGAREIFEQDAPAIVQRLAGLGADKADFFVFKAEEVMAGGELHRIELRLNERGRAAVTVLEKVAGGSLEDALNAPLSDLFNRVTSEAVYEFEKYDDGMGNPDVGSVEFDWYEIAIDQVGYDSIPPAQLEFEFTGKFEAAGSTTVARDSPLGGELEYVQGDMTVSARFTFVLAWEPSDPVGQFSFDQVWLEDWDADVWIAGERYLHPADTVGNNNSENDGS